MHERRPLCAFGRGLGKKGGGIDARGRAKERGRSRANVPFDDVPHESGGFQNVARIARVHHGDAHDGSMAIHGIDRAEASHAAASSENRLEGAETASPFHGRSIASDREGGHAARRLEVPQFEPQVCGVFGEMADRLAARTLTIDQNKIAPIPRSDHTPVAKRQPSG